MLALVEFEELPEGGVERYQPGIVVVPELGGCILVGRSAG
jgi:hypothetical protein